MQSDSHARCNLEVISKGFACKIAFYLSDEDLCHLLSTSISLYQCYWSTLHHRKLLLLKQRNQELSAILVWFAEECYERVMCDGQDDAKEDADILDEMYRVLLKHGFVERCKRKMSC